MAQRRKLAGGVGAAMGKVSDAYQAAISFADGPDDGPEFSDVIDVDQNGFDTTIGGGVVGRTIEWRCGAGGTASCPSIAIHDGSTALENRSRVPVRPRDAPGASPGRLDHRRRRAQAAASRSASR